MLQLEWFNCLLPLQQNMSPLVVELERKRKLKLSGGLMPVSPKFNAHTHRLGFLCLASQHDGQTNKQTKNKNKKRQTRPRSSAGSRPPLPKFSGQVKVEAHYIFHRSTIWVRPLFTELGPKTPKKANFAMKQTNICCLSGDIHYVMSLYNGGTKCCVLLQDNGEIVLPQDMKKCQVYAGRKISFEPEEVTQMKAFDSSGLESFWISVLHLSEPFIICLFF